MPKKNEKDLVEVPQEVKKKLKFVFVETVDEAFRKAFGGTLTKAFTGRIG
jgi:ATP-dependent Lon protease